MRTSLTVYSKPACVQCDATYRALDKKDADYVSIDISEDQAAREYAMSLGYLQAPVVVQSNPDGSIVHWGGFSPDKVQAFIAIQQAELAAEQVGAAA